MRASRSFLLAFTGLTTALSLGCGGESTAGDPADPPGEVVASAKTRNTRPQVSSGDLAELAKGNTDFAFAFYGQAVDGDENAFYSPYSISIALAMTYAGAANDTQKQMAEALHFTLPPAKLHAAFDAVDLALARRAQGKAEQDGQPFKLNVADAIWGQKGMAFEPSFLDTLATNYGAGLRVTDFAKSPEQSRTRINQWVASETEDKISNLLPANSIDGSTRLVLVNAIYFNAGWATPFNDELTTERAFSLLDGHRAEVKTMFGGGELRYAEGDGYKAVELPYTGKETSMVVLLPDAGEFATIEHELSGSFVQKVFASLRTAEVNLAVPKFKIDGATVSLKKSLEKLGMIDAFDAGKADFSKLLSPKIDRLFVDDVLHQAFVSVDEKGTEAAAATAVVANDASIPADIKSFDANRPFFFFIRDIPTNTVLFVGRLTHPD